MDYSTLSLSSYSLKPFSAYIDEKTNYNILGELQRVSTANTDQCLIWIGWQRIMEQNTLSTDSAKRIYNLLGPYYDWFEFYEGRAKSRALELLQLAPGQCVLNAGLGTGKQHLDIQTRINPDGVAHGFDLSPRQSTDRFAHLRSRCSPQEHDLRNH